MIAVASITARIERVDLRTVSKNAGAGVLHEMSARNCSVRCVFLPNWNVR